MCQYKITVPEWWKKMMEKKQEKNEKSTAFNAKRSDQNDAVLFTFFFGAFTFWACFMCGQCSIFIYISNESNTDKKEKETK